MHDLDQCVRFGPRAAPKRPRAPKCLGADFATPIIVVWGLLLPNIETQRTLLGGTQNEISHTGCNANVFNSVAVISTFDDEVGFTSIR